MSHLKSSVAYAVLLFSFLGAGYANAQSINVARLGFTPTVDGNDSEWSSIRSTSIPLNTNRKGGKSNIQKVSLKAGTHGDRIYVLVKWKDNTEDNMHKPFVWSDSKGKYVAGSQREDRLALQFEMSGNYDTNWLSGNEFTADMWHWKAARTNPAGLAHDKSTIISKQKLKKSYKGKTASGDAIYIKRPSDKGDKLYKTKRYSKKTQDIVPKYILAQNPKGSISDISAKGVWKNGEWTLEFSRKLNTNHKDDAVFKIGKSIKAGIAVFDHSGDDDHNYSDTLIFNVK